MIPVANAGGSVKIKLNDHESGRITISVMALLTLLVILFAANIDAFQDSKKFIYQIRQREALIKLANVTTTILSNKVACKSFLTDSGLKNLNWNSFAGKEIELKLYDNAGNSGSLISEKILVPQRI